MDAHEHEIVLRELYPTKSDLYERAHDLKIEHEGTRSETSQRSTQKSQSE